MNNVTILASEPVMIANPLAVTLALIGVGIMVVALILILILRNCTIPIITAAIGICVSVGALGWACMDQVEDYVQYSVLISDDANFKEIYKKYEILEVKGEIYEVREIEVND